MNNKNNNTAYRAAPKQPASSYYRQRLANSIGKDTSRVPQQPARAAIPNDTNMSKRPLENSYRPPTQRSSAPSNSLAPKDSFYKQSETYRPPPRPASKKSNARPNAPYSAPQQPEPKRYHHPSYEYDLDVDMDDAYEPTLVHQKPKRPQHQQQTFTNTNTVASKYFDDDNVDVEMRDVSPIVLASQPAAPRRSQQQQQHEFKLTPLNSRLLSDIIYRGTHFYIRGQREALTFVEVIARVQEVIKKPTPTQAQWVLKITDDTSPQTLLLEYWDLNDNRANFEVNMAYRFVGTLSPANNPTVTVKCFWFDAVRNASMLKFNKLLTQILHDSLKEA